MKTHEEILETNLITDVEELLNKAEEAITKGQYRDAYELSLRATDLAPRNADAWLLRASLSNRLDEKLMCVNRLTEMGAAGDDRHNVAFFTLHQVLEGDPSLVYTDETDDLYRVRNPQRDVLSIPKKRSIAVSYPDREKSPLDHARRWLVLALFGLLFAGLGALLFAPLAAWSAFHAGRAARGRSVRVDSKVVLAFAALTFLMGLGFGALLLIHLAG